LRRLRLRKEFEAQPLTIQKISAGKA